MPGVFYFLGVFMDTMLDYMAASFLEGLKMRTLDTCGRWAEHRRIMSAPFPGPYSFRVTPWVREPTDCQSAITCAMKSAQTGFSEMCLNRALWTICQQRRDVLYALPTQGNASDFSKSRFDTAISLSPYLKDIFVAADSVGLKSTGANSLYIRGTRSDASLKSIPVSELILDEMDEMDEKALWLALERLSGQVHKHICAVSTPTIPRWGIHRFWLDSTQEFYYFTCPSCGRTITLTWPDSIEIVGETTSDPRCKESFLKCSLCKSKLPHEGKMDWLSTGHWIKTNDKVDPAECRGFHINQMFSSTVSPGEIVVAYHRGLGDEIANKEFHNSKLGLPFIGEGAQITDVDIDAALKNYTINDPRPNTSGRCFTMGADQGKVHHVSIVEWFNIRHTYDIHASATARLVWFGKVAGEDWGYFNELMREWMILACVIDADPEIGEARALARRFPGYVWLSRYRRGKQAREVVISEEETGAPMATVDRTSWLSCTLGRFRTKPPRIELPRDLSLEYREHLKALVRTYEKDETGNPTATYKSVSADHYSHSLNYASIALPFAASINTGESIAKFL
jgi:hypothetical protein